MRASHDGVGVHRRMEIAAGVAGGSGHRGGDRLDDRTRHLRPGWIVEEDRGGIQRWKLTSNPLDRKSCHVVPLCSCCTSLCYALMRWKPPSCPRRTYGIVFPCERSTYRADAVDGERDDVRAAEGGVSMARASANDAASLGAS